MKKTAFIILSLLVALTLSAQKNIYKFSAKDISGKAVKLSKYKGKVVLIVNTATACGFTPQYTELQKLYEALHSKGLEILDFPCNQFGEQAQGSIQSINAFCTGKYGITFPQFDKIEVNGKNAHPLYVYLKSQQKFQGFDTNTKIGKLLDEKFSSQDPNYKDNPDVKWNFTKFLVDRTGKVVERFEPTVSMDYIEKVIRLLLVEDKVLECY